MPKHINIRDFQMQFHEQYESIKRMYKQIENEEDVQIKYMILEVIEKKYENLMSLIERGASFDKDILKNEYENCKKEIKRLKNIYENI